MTLQIHGAVIDKRTSIDKVKRYLVHVVPKLKSGTDNFVSLIFMCDPPSGHTFQLKLDLPHGFVLTDNDWHHFLHYLVQNSPDRKLKNKSILSDGTSITSRYHLGSLYFQIKTTDRVIGLLVTDSEPSDEAPFSEKQARDIGSISVFQKIFAKESESIAITYSRTKLMINVRWGDNPPKFNVDNDVNDHDIKQFQEKQFFIDLNSKMSEEQLLMSCIKGDSSIELKPEVFVNPVNPMVDSSKNQLLLRNIGAFYWLESSNGNLKCSIAKNPAIQAVNAILNFIDQWECSSAVKTYLIEAFTTRLRLYGNEDGDQSSNILQSCVYFSENFQRITGHSIHTLKPL